MATLLTPGNQGKSQAQEIVYTPPALTSEEIESRERIIAEEARAAEMKLRSETLYAKAKKLVGSKQGQCVIAVRKFIFGNPNIGREYVQGAARTMRVDSHDPEPGDIVKLGMSKVGHVGVVLIVDKENNRLTYYDSNGNWTGRAAIRTIPLNSKKIQGYRKIINIKQLI